MKKTVITTEKREVWIIREPPASIEDHEVTRNEAEPFVDLRVEPFDDLPETDTPPDETEREEDLKSKAHVAPSSDGATMKIYLDGRWIILNYLGAIK